MLISNYTCAVPWADVTGRNQLHLHNPLYSGIHTETKPYCNDQIINHYIVVFILRQNVILLTASIKFDYFIMKFVIGGCKKHFSSENVIKIQI